jgi:hypothetical protein
VDHLILDADRTGDFELTVTFAGEYAAESPSTTT